MEKGNLESIDGLYEYMLEHSIRESEVAHRLRLEGEKGPLSIYQIPPEQGQLMALLTKMINAKRAIEIGVYRGYSTLCVAQALPDDGKIIACDITDQWAGEAKQYWREAGVMNKIDLRIAPAVNTLDTLLSEGQAESFDFIFIDADKGGYDTYYEMSLKLLRKGGVIVLDNVFLLGAVVDSNNIDDSLRNILSESDIQVMRDLNIKLKSDERVDISTLFMVDGITLIYKR